MLGHRLQFPLGYQLVHPIGVCICGIISNFIALMKLFREHKQVIKLRKFVSNASASNQTSGLRQDSKLITYQDDGRIDMVDA